MGKNNQFLAIWNYFWYLHWLMFCLLERLLFCSMSGKTLLKYEFFRDTQLNIMPDETFLFKPSDSLFWHLHRKMMSPCHLSGKRYHHFSTTFYSFETPWSLYLLQALASSTFWEIFLIMLAASDILTSHHSKEKLIWCFIHL